MKVIRPHFLSIRIHACVAPCVTRHIIPLGEMIASSWKSEDVMGIFSPAGSTCGASASATVVRL
jgi:hypothetical protein